MAKQASATSEVSTVLEIVPPRDYLLARDVCSYGYFVLEPNLWLPEEGSLRRVLTLPSITTACVISQGDAGSPLRARRGMALRVRFDCALNDEQLGHARAQISRMLRLDEDEAIVRRFHRLDPRWKRSGRARLFRSPTLFEDVIKTVTSCNVTWSSTILMNRRLCEVFGKGGGFPTPRRLAQADISVLRGRCSVGYRDARIIELAKLFDAGERGKSGGIDVGWFENPATSDDDIHEALVELPGIGPYAAANIMQLLGRYARLPCDTESVRHGKTVLGMSGTSAQIMKRVRAHFEPMGVEAFRAYWFEIWDCYERRHGPAWQWQRDSTGKLFTTAQLKKLDEAKQPRELRNQKKKSPSKSARRPHRTD